MGTTQYSTAGGTFYCLSSPRCPKAPLALDKVYFAKRDKMYSYLDTALYLLLVLFAIVFRVLPSAHQGLQYALAFEKKVIE